MSENTITVKEFKMWLEGVEEMQPEGWSPDQRQWTRIREKINSVVESDTPPLSPPSVTYRDQPIQTYSEQQYNPPPQLTYQAGGGLSRQPAPPPNSSLFGNADMPSVPTKTPTVDSSTGTYEPPFI